EPLEQLRLAIRRYVVFSADHPELVALMNIEARQDTDRLGYVYHAGRPMRLPLWAVGSSGRHAYPPPESLRATSRLAWLGPSIP
ncbi:MAG: hypothetical protein QOD39_494, partial [Mycobacterium sp.]|nr:hypothetical protein [Mycobacterium sp.]